MRRSCTQTQTDRGHCRDDDTLQDANSAASTSTAVPLPAANADPIAPAVSPPAHTPTHTPAPRAPLSPLTHILIFGAVLGPVALLPYLLVRRSLHALHRDLTALGGAHAALQRDLRAALLETAVRREEHARLRALLDGTRREVEALRAEGARRVVAEERMRRDVQELLVERQRTRAGLATLRDLSASLADIAAFMHEVEVQQGFVSRKNDGRGIERIRQLAYRLQGIPVGKDASTDTLYVKEEDFLEQDHDASDKDDVGEKSGKP